MLEWTEITLPLVCVPESQFSNSDIVRLIHAGDPAGIEVLYKTVIRGLRAFFASRTGPDADELAHKSFLATVESLTRNGMNHPERLMGYLHTIARRQLVIYIAERTQARQQVQPDEFIRDQRTDPESLVLESERNAIMAAYLRAMRPRDREILDRFYVRGQSPQQIQAAMRLTDNQFRLIKSRAKAEFAKRVRGRLAPRRLSAGN